MSLLRVGGGSYKHFPRNIGGRGKGRRESQGISYQKIHMLQQYKDTVPSWKEDFVANHFSHNAPNRP